MQKYASNENCTQCEPLILHCWLDRQQHLSAPAAEVNVCLKGGSLQPQWCKEKQSIYKEEITSVSWDIMRQSKWPSLFTQVGVWAWVDCLLSCPAWQKTEKPVHSSSLGEEDRQYHSLGNDICINKVKSCSFWGLVCPAWSITITEQGARQGPSMRAPLTPCSLGRKQALHAHQSVMCQGILQHCWTQWDALQAVTAMGMRQWTLFWFPCRRKQCEEDENKSPVYCCMEMRRGLPLILKKTCALCMPRPGITSKALLSGTGSMTYLHMSVLYTYCIKM